MNNRYILDESMSDSIKNIWKNVKYLVYRSEQGDDVTDEAEEIKNKVESSFIPKIIRNTILGILIALIGATSVQAKTFDSPSDNDYKKSELTAKSDAMFDKLEKDIAKAEAKYGKNFGSVIEIEQDVGFIEKIAAVLDKGGNYGVKVKHFKTIERDGEEMKIIKFDNGSGLVMTKSGVLQFYNSNGDKTGDFWGSKVDNMFDQAKALIHHNAQDIHEALSVLTKAGYTLLKD